jgi:putative phage-type endonuclease
MERKEFIGGSDIAAVMGLSRWATPLQLWSIKTGKVSDPDLSENEAVEMGNELEDTVARVFMKRTGLKVRRAPKRYIHPNYEYMACQVDRLVEGTDELLECKTASAWKVKEWEGEEIPQEYILQVMWQLGITGRNIGWIAVLIGGQKFVYKKIEFDAALFAKMEEAAIKFWIMVKEGTAPMALGDDNEFIVQIYPQNDEQIQQIDEMNARIALLQQTKSQITDLIAQKDEIEAAIKQVIGGTAGIQTQEYVVTWKTQLTTRVDTEALKSSGDYQKYAVTNEVRVLRVRRVK